MYIIVISKIYLFYFDTFSLGSQEKKAGKTGIRRLMIELRILPFL